MKRIEPKRGDDENKRRGGNRNARKGKAKGRI